MFGFETMALAIAILCETSQTPTSPSSTSPSPDLLLSAAELSSSLSALRLEVAGQVHDEVVRVGALGGFINFFLASILPGSAGVRSHDTEDTQQDLP